MEYINKQLKLILSKLEGLKTKLETVIETINITFLTVLERFSFERQKVIDFALLYATWLA